MSEQDWFTKDFYKELGVDKTADDATIKKAYRKLARTYHPDQNPGDATAEARFKDISEAYTVLSDKQQRQKYDAIRQMAGGGARFAPGGGAGFEDLFGGMFGAGSGNAQFSGTHFDASNLGGLFGNLFGSPHQHTNPFGNAQNFGGQFGGNFGSPSFGTPPPPQKPTKGKDLKSSVTLTFRQALKGSEIRLKVDNKPVNARIPAGVKDGQKIKLAGKGKAGTHGGSAGDLLITIHVTPHSHYTRQGNDLHLHVPITLAEAINGATIDIPLLDGTTTPVTIPAGVTSADTITLAQHGVRTATATGNLIVHLRIDIPHNLSSEARDAAHTFAQATASHEPRTALNADILNS